MQEMAKYVKMIESYVRGTTTRPDMGAMTHHRNFAQYQLLSLSPGREREFAFNQMYPMYEPCRLAALIFGIGVTFPLPGWAAPFPGVVLALQQALINMNIDPVSCVESDLLLWILVLGGTAAMNMLAREWFVSRLRVISLRKRLYGWEEIKVILTEILWLASACDRAGSALWDEVVQLE